MRTCTRLIPCGAVAVVAQESNHVGELAPRLLPRCADHPPPAHLLAELIVDQVADVAGVIRRDAAERSR